MHVVGLRLLCLAPSVVSLRRAAVRPLLPLLRLLLSPLLLLLRLLSPLLLLLPVVLVLLLLLLLRRILGVVVIRVIAIIAITATVIVLITAVPRIITRKSLHAATGEIVVLPAVACKSTDASTAGTQMALAMRDLRVAGAFDGVPPADAFGVSGTTAASSSHSSAPLPTMSVCWLPFV